MSGKSLWSVRDFRRLWIGQAISELGSRISREGIPIAALRLLNATPIQMGFLAALGSASVLLISLFAGVWVDAQRKRPLLIAADLGRAAVLVTIPIAAVFHALTMQHLYIATALAGILTVLFDVCYQTYVPLLLDRQNLPEGNAKLALTSSIAEIIGPGLTGLLIQTITAPFAILFDAISFLVSAGSVALIRTAEIQPVPAKPEPFGEQYGGGISYVIRHPVLRLLTARSVMVFLFGGFFGTLYSLYALQTLRLPPLVFGFVIAAGGVGNLLGALFAERIGTRFGLGRVFLFSALISGLGLFFVPLASGPVWLAALSLSAQQVIGDSGSVVYYVNEISLRQSITPEHLLGRVNAAVQLATRGVYPLGTLLGGLLAELLGVRATLWIGCCGVLLSAIFLLGSPIQRLTRVETVDTMTLFPAAE